MKGGFYNRIMKGIGAKPYGECLKVIRRGMDSSLTPGSYRYHDRKTGSQNTVSEGFTGQAASESSMVRFQGVRTPFHPAWGGQNAAYIFTASGSLRGR